MRKYLSSIYLSACIVLTLLITNSSCSVKESPPILNQNSPTSSPPVIEWESTFGGDNFDGAKTGVVTSDGGVIIVGKSDSERSGDKSESPKGKFDIWVVRIDKTGKKVWDKTIGGNENDEPNDIIATSDGGYIIVAESPSNIFGDKTENRRTTNNSYLYSQVYTTTPSDYWIIKIDENGKKIWDKTLGGFNTDIPQSISATNDGGFLIAGGTRSEPSAPVDANRENEKTEVSRGIDDYWVVKISATGQKIWDKTFGGLSTDTANKIISTADGGFIIAGTSNSKVSPDKSENNKGIYDYWVIKISSTGQKIWDKTFGGDKEQYAQSIAPTSDGGFIIGGYSYSGISVDKSESNRGISDYWVVKISATGQKIWDKTFGGDKTDYLYSVLPSSDDGFLLAGQSSSTANSDKTNSQIGLWLVKINNNGMKLWDTSFEDKKCIAFITDSKGVYYNIGSVFPTGRDTDYKLTKIKF